MQDELSHYQLISTNLIASLFSLQVLVKTLPKVSQSVKSKLSSPHCQSAIPSIKVMVIGSNSERITQIEIQDAKKEMQAAQEEYELQSYLETSRMQTEVKQQERILAELNYKQKQHEKIIQLEMESKFYEAKETERIRLYREQRQRFGGGYTVSSHNVLPNSNNTSSETDPTISYILNLRMFWSEAAEKSGKIILPPSALQELVTAKVLFPLTFRCEKLLMSTTLHMSPDLHHSNMQIADQNQEILNAGTNNTSSSTISGNSNHGRKFTYVTVLDFSAPENVVLAPRRFIRKIMRNFSLVQSNQSKKYQQQHECQSMVQSISSNLKQQMQNVSDSNESISIESSQINDMSLREAGAEAVEEDNELDDEDSTEVDHDHSSTEKSIHGEGEMICLQTVTLERGLSAVFQPFQPSWFRIPEVERAACLELYLSKLTFLEKDQRIRVIYNGQPHFLKVISCLPQDIVNITDTDLVTEVILPDPSKLAEDAKLWTLLNPDMELSEHTSGVNNHVPESIILTNQMHFYRFYVEKKDVHSQFMLSLDVLPSFSPNCDSSRAQPHEQSFPDCDLYVCTAVQRPSPPRHTWKNEAYIGSRNGGQKTLFFSSDDPNFHVGHYFVTVRAFHGPAKYRLTFKRLRHGVTRIATKSVDSSDKISVANQTNVPMHTCENCDLQLPTYNSQLHILRCSKLNFKCKDCQKCMPMEEKFKHVMLEHTKYECVCGERCDQHDMPIHRNKDCKHRLVKCLFCPLRIRKFELSSHHQECALKISHCNRCNVPLKRREMKFHISQVHSVKLDDISVEDWS
jgi:hypothetical protein